MKTQAKTGVRESRSCKGNSGRRIADVSALLERLRGRPPQVRSTVRSATAAIDLSPCTLYRHIKDGEARVAVRNVKPVLTDANKGRRLAFCCDRVYLPATTFDDMHGDVHADEKLF